MIPVEKKLLTGYTFIDLFAGLGGFRIALESLGANCVYSNEWDIHVQKVLNAADYGIPQKRERIYMVCFRNDLEINDFKFPKPFKLTHHVEDLLLKDEEIVKDLYIDRSDTYYNGVEDNQYSNKTIRLGVVSKGRQGERIYSTKGIAITLSAYGGGIFAKTGGYLINGRTRKLHPRECDRIMGYPDSYKICKSRNQAYKQFGNSVVIDVLQLIAIEIGIAMKKKK